MFSKYRFLCSEIMKGKSVLRSFLNLRLKQEQLKGKVIDIGGGSGEQYLAFMSRAEGVSFETFDLKVGKQVDFEKDSLPAATDSYDTVLFLNVMEHIFNYQHIANEVVRITKTGGQLIGFVPFLMWYHPDHRDFFRYTHESLEIIFKQTGVSDIKIDTVSMGPFIAASHITLLTYPKILRIFVFSWAYFMDTLYLRLRRNNVDKYALGYLFTIKK